MNTLRTKIDIAFYCAFGAALLIGLVGISMATDTAPAVVHSKTVRYADLDLTKPAGAKVLYGRIRVAAREVCGFGDWPLPVNYQGCVDGAIDNAVTKVNSPALTTLHLHGKTLLASN